MKVALTGATGHLGAAVLQELFQKGITIKALIRGTDFSSREGLPVEIVNGDILQKDPLQKLLEGSDALIHCAAFISVNGDPKGMVHRTNVEGTGLVLETAKQCGIKRVIHISSIHAYNQRPSFELLDENREKAGEKAYAYDRSKKLGQEIALAMNGPEMEVLVMNPTSIVGPYDFKPSKVGKVILDLYSGRLPFVFDGGFDFCDCRDVAHAIVNGLTLGRPGENYLLPGKWHSLKELAGLFSRVSGKQINVIAFPPVIGKAGLPFIKSIAYLKKKEPLYTIEALDALFAGNRCISSAKAKQELMYTIRPFEETLRDTFGWFQNKGYLV
ncbi:MAG: NAD-dependent epimerase/dehydratase family protein [Chitinophagaceae bacterium]